MARDAAGEYDVPYLDSAISFEAAEGQTDANGVYSTYILWDPTSMDDPAAEPEQYEVFVPVWDDSISDGE